MCVVLNNVEHVSEQLNTLHTSLHWKEACCQLAIKYDRPTLVGSSYVTLENIVKDTQKAIKMKKKQLIMKVVGNMNNDLGKFLKGEFISNPTATKVWEISKVDVLD